MLTNLAHSMSQDRLAHFLSLWKEKAHQRDLQKTTTFTKQSQAIMIMKKKILIMIILRKMIIDEVGLVQVAQWAMTMMKNHKIILLCILASKKAVRMEINSLIRMISGQSKNLP